MAAVGTDGVEKLHNTMAGKMTLDAFFKPVPKRPATNLPGGVGRGRGAPTTSTSVSGHLPARGAARPAAGRGRGRRSMEMLESIERQVEESVDDPGPGPAAPAAAAEPAPGPSPDRPDPMSIQDCIIVSSPTLPSLSTSPARKTSRSVRPPPKTPVRRLPSTPTTPSTRQRKFQDDFMAFGFTCDVVEGQDRPRCIVCNELLAQESTKPAKLKRHQETKHQALVGKPINYFQRLLFQTNIQREGFQKRITVPMKALRASFEVSLLIAKQKKPHSFGKNLVLPAACKTVEVMFDQSKAEVLQCIPLSDDTVKRRITACAEDMEEQLLEKVRKSPLFALQLDESTDVESKAQLICLVKYCAVNVVGNKTIEEDFLFCVPIEGKANAANIFDILDRYLTKKAFLWSNCVGVCTDGAPVMVGTRSGFKGLVLKANPKISFTHCIIHRESLAAGLDENSPFQEVLAVVVNMVNVIKAHPLQTRLFKLLREEVGAPYTALLYYSKPSIWRRKALNDLYDMFLTLHELLEDVTLIIKQQIIDHLESLATKMEEWFGDLPGEEMDWVRNPFPIEEWNMPPKHLEELTDLQADRTLARKVMHIVGCMQQRIRL
ncbi:Zinc finger MYM-type protein 6 [Frankliniella fusca]|uniref:Zinc finger MYM-type protein 6 n=1 Tax=Frankliniella fusca TaxID=407009 RepID=A0AAE1LKY1_9NEOP|nr:Zinc finger MYM-type protein 6 [Frankliniella fusca]